MYIIIYFNIYIFTEIPKMMTLITMSYYYFHHY